MTSDLSLAARAALPDALRVLVTEFPRDAWQAHPNYSQLIAFWLDRHLMFRRLLDQLNSDAQSALDGRTDPQLYKRKLVHFGGMLINELHGHHQIEDAHYFPVMARLDGTAARGFDLLDSDHHALDGILAGLTDSANAVLQAPESKTATFRDGTGAFHQKLADFAPLLNRHLVDEEELVVPVLLKYAPAELR